MTNTLASLVAHMATIDPEAEALVGLDARYSWHRYERESAAVAGSLLRAGIHRGDRVAIGFHKDARSFVAVHGALRAGAVVVPLDPMSPPSVARALLADAQVTALFVDSRRCDQLDPWSIDGLDLQLVVTSTTTNDRRTTCWDDTVVHRSDVVLPLVDPQDAAYVIYTSGSTGRSKGIVHTHASAMAYATRAVRARALRSTDRVAGMSPFHFDMSTLELYAAPLAGAAVVVFGEAHMRFPASFTARSQDEQVSVWYAVSSFVRQVVERGAVDQRDLSMLRLVAFAGEVYSPGALSELRSALPTVAIENVYGPAEVNECTNHIVTDACLLGRDVPIGRAWDGVELRVVDDHGVDVPSGQPGELWVSAPTVMSGYWQRPDLDEQVLIAREDAPAWYRTGDVVVMDADGVVWFRGRRDHQVKIRGMRIELEAVESILSDAPDVLHAVAVPAGSPSEATHVSAVVVLRDGAVLDEAGLRRFCAERLPMHAVPREIVTVDHLPSTPSGKIDRRHVRSQFAGSMLR